MRGYARRITGSFADADDAVQESLLQAWTKLGDLSEPNAVRGWMMRITANASINLVRRRKSTTSIDAVEDPADPAPTPETAALTATGMTALTAALARLPEEQRHCWVLKEMGNQSYEEIARTLGITSDSVRGRLSRARATLLKEMEAWQ
ncbi:sigma-70 family RNA polymerase sigma factor [Paenarthrobacter sp. Z7-10]|nr:sigma-70 family RNA polymerase sigma factor [Paenarthrobacter sp. Z7-10]